MPKHYLIDERYLEKFYVIRYYCVVSFSLSLFFVIRVIRYSLNGIVIILFAIFFILADQLWCKFILILDIVI